MELRPRHGTGHGQQYACSSAMGASKPPTTYVTKPHLGHRLPPGLKARGAGILSSTSAKGTGAAGGTQPKTPGSLLLPALRNVHAAVGRTGAARLPALSADQRNSSSRGKLVATHPSERAGAAWQNRRVRHQRVTGPGTPSVFVSVLQVLTATRGERQLLFPLSYTQAAQKMEYALKRLRCQLLRITPMPSGTVAQAKTALSTPEAWRKFGHVEDGTALPVYDDSKSMRDCPL